MKTTLENIHTQRKKRNLFTALIVVLLFGGFAFSTILFNILTR